MDPAQNSGIAASGMRTAIFISEFLLLGTNRLLVNKSGACRQAKEKLYGKAWI